MFRCVLNADLVRRAWSCVSTEETRYYLNGVKVEPRPEGGALLIATDGHKMIVLMDPNGFVEDQAIVSLRPDMLKALRAKPPRSGERFLIVEGQRAVVAATLAECGPDLVELARNPTHEVEAYQPADALIDANFPDWRRVLPDDSQPAQGTMARFNGDYLAVLAGALTSDRARAIQMQTWGATPKDGAASPHLILGDGSVAGFGILMPIRGGEESLSLPGWVRSTPGGNVVALKAAG